MEQMAAEITLKPEVEDKGVANKKDDNPAWAGEVDCADVVLNCLFCRFHDMVSILPDCCQGLTNHCWGSYRHVDHTGESLHNDADDSCVELDCGLLGNCHDASDCLELAMEVSEICYH